jgi:hypothetical protein
MSAYVIAVLLYVLGAFITADLLLAWFGTDFPAHWLGLPDWQSFREWCQFQLGSMGFIFNMLGKLLTCPICLGHWFAAAVAVFMHYFMQAPWDLVVPGIFSWPLLSFILLKKLGIF